MEHDPIANDVRRAKRGRRLGPSAACAKCGLSDPEALVTAGRTLLELHHVVGHATDEALTVPLCRNCHAVETEGLRNVGASMAQPATLLHRIVNVLRALGEFLSSVGRKLLAWAEHLAGYIGALDTRHPSWRDMPEAQAT
jgi:hypothetical protein